MKVATIQRNEEIKRKFNELKKDTKSDTVISQLAEEYSVQFDTIRLIVYTKEKK